MPSLRTLRILDLVPPGLPNHKTSGIQDGASGSPSLTLSLSPCRSRPLPWGH